MKFLKSSVKLEKDCELIYLNIQILSSALINANLGHSTLIYLVLKVVSATFLLVYFVCLKASTCETRKNVFYFTLEALFVLGIIKF